LQIKTKIVSCHTADSKPVKQEVNGTVILPPLVFPAFDIYGWAGSLFTHYTKATIRPKKCLSILSSVKKSGSQVKVNCKRPMSKCSRGLD
jgi:hypothetical protein